MLKIITSYFFYLMMLSPILGYIIRGIYKLQVAIVSILGILGLIIFIFIFLEKESKPIRLPKYLFWGLLFAIYYTIWGFYNGRIEEFGTAKFILANQYFLVLIILIIIENTLFSEKFINRIIFFIKTTIIAAILVSVYQLLIDHTFLLPERTSKEILQLADRGQYELRIQSIFGYLDQNDLGLSFIPLISIFIGFHFYNKKTNILTICFIILAGLVCFLSNGRYIIFNYLLIFSQLLFLNQIKVETKIKYIFAFVVMIISVLSGLVYFGYDLDNFYKERIMSESASSRILAFEMFGKFFMDQPLLGTGLRRTDKLMTVLYGRSSQIHVGYLSVLFEYGLLGGLFLFNFWYNIVKSLYTTAKKSSYFGSFIGFSTFLVANLVLVQYSIFFYGIIFSLVFSKYFYNKTGYDNKKYLISI